MMVINLPYPPSVNHYKKIGRLIRTKKGKLLQPRVNTLKTKRYFFEVFMIVQQFKAFSGFAGLGSARIQMEVDVYPPDKRKRDLDGILKVSLDALQHANVFDDDSQIDRLFVRRRDIIVGGQLIVGFQEI